MSKHSVTWNADDRLIEAKTVGFWSEEDFATYERDLQIAIDRAKGRPSDLIVDVSERAPQAPQLLVSYERTGARFAASGLRRLVMVGASALLRAQIKRVTGELHPHFAASLDEGREWLKDQP